MFEQFEAYLHTSGMAALLAEKGAVLTAYSGGADSTLLLHWLHRWCVGKGISLYAAHVHHGIRGTEADRDAGHCRETAAALQIPLYITRVDVPALAAERGMGIEECARAERYAYFDAVCTSLGMPDMPAATAHNADDQLETVLFHMLRGSGLSGMTGIAPIREKRYIRPLLTFSGETIRQICQKEGYAYVEDSTNRDTAYSRNCIRHEILPVLRKLTPHPEEAAGRMTKLLTRDSEYLETEAAARLKEAGENPLNREILRQTHPAIGTRILRMAYGKYAPGMSMTAEQTDTLYTMAAAENRQTRHLSLPGGVTAVIRCNTVRFMTGTGRAETESDRKQHPAEREVPPLTPGETVILDWGARKIVLSRKSLPKHPENLENIYNLSIQHPINFAKIKGVLCLRTRKAGDTIRYGGMARKIRKLQNEYRVPPEKRETMLLLADEEEILWAEGWEACDKVKSDRTENDILWIGIWCPRGPEETEDPVRIQKHDETTEADHGTEDRPG